jgi:hypothetical protein
VVHDALVEATVVAVRDMLLRDAGRPPTIVPLPMLHGVTPGPA